jgi:hypothetical protein
MPEALEDFVKRQRDRLGKKDEAANEAACGAQ